MGKIRIKPMSVNQAWQGKRFKTPKYKLWRQQMYVLLPHLDVPKNIFLKVSITFGFSNKGSDIDNPLKPFLDALQDRYGFNDSKIYELTVKKEIVKKGEEFIRFEIEEV